MQKLLEFPDRDIYLACPANNSQVAVFYIADHNAGGILINSPPYSEALFKTLTEIAPVNFLFLPSIAGATYIDQWKTRHPATQTIMSAEEATQIREKIDIVLDRKTRLTRTIGFVALSGRTAGCHGLQLRNLPGVIFFGPSFEHDARDGWPALIAHNDDYSWENRVIGSLGLQSLSFQYAFCDNFTDQNTMRFGPDAATQMQRKLELSYD